MSKQTREVWIGRVHVASKRRGRSDVLKGARGAYVNVLVWAAARFEYRERVRKAMVRLRLKVLEMVEVNPLSIYDISGRKKLQRLANEVRRTHQPRFGTFHLYDK